MKQLIDVIDKQPVSQTAVKPWLASLLLQRRPRLGNRFLHFYRRLQQLPRRLRRQLAQRLAVGLTGAALLLALSRAPVSANAIAVDDGLVDIDEGDGRCSLSEAIHNANDDAATYPDCTAGSGADILNLTPGGTFLAERRYFQPGGLHNGLPLITTEIAIEGNGSTIRPSAYASNMFTLLVVQGTGDLTLNNLTIRDFVNLDGYHGAAVRVYPTYGFPDFAGGNASLTITNSTLSGNQSDRRGSAVAVTAYSDDMATVSISNSTISGNIGNAVLIQGYYATVTATITNSTITGNTGEGIHGFSFDSDIAVTLNRSIISGNSTSYAGVEVDDYYGNSIIANNYNLFGHDGLTNAAAFNNFTPGATDITATSNGTMPTALADILDTTLAANDGTTETHALPPGSPAIDAAPSTACVAPDFDLDQRGEPRNANGDGTPSSNECDIGAYELQPVADGDSDGVDSAVEDGAPNDGDGNNDGLPDSQQANVTSLPNSVDDEYVTLVAPEGTRLVDVSATGNPSPGDAPAGVDFPVGFLDFRVEDVTPGGMVVVEVILANGASVNTYYKYGPTADNAADHWYEFLDNGTTGAEFLSDRILLHFVDGQRGDGDLTADGVITDPGAPGMEEVAAAVNVYVSTTAAGTTADEMSFDKHDILKWDGSNWSLFFDGSDHGLTTTQNVNAIDIPDSAETEAYISFANQKTTVAPLGQVFGQDVLHFNGSSFSFFFDGSDVGLTTAGERIDGLEVLDGSASPIGGDSCQAYLLLSTAGSGKVPAAGGGTLNFRGEDVLGFCATTSGSSTNGLWHLVLDGSAAGMPKNATFSLSANEDGTVLYFTTKGTFNVPGAIGGHSMVYRYDTVAETFSGPHFVAAAAGLSQQVDALHVEGDLP